jgi:putative ATP-binding cassette transporter
MVRALPILKDAWHLAKPYFRSEEKWSAWLLLAAIVALNLALVGMNVVFNFWNGQWFDSLQNKDWNAFISLLLTWHVSKTGFMPGFLLLATVYVLVSVYAVYLNQWLQIRWRRWLTRHFLDEWLADRAYYRLSLTANPRGTGTDNPDQRISEDLRDFTTNTLSLGIDLMSNIVTLGSFAGVLWSLSGTLHVMGVGIPGYMFWVALIYSALGTWVTHLVGSPLAVLRFLQQRYEADFRFSLVRFRENVEGVALYGGEREERTWMANTFHSVILNWWDLMRRIKLLNALTSTYSTLVMVFPYLVAAPRYFAGQILLGGLMRTGQAFGQVQGSMSWFVNSYSQLATWSATVERLATFERAVAAARAASGTGVLSEPNPAAPALALHDVNLALPGGEPLLADQSLAFAPGERTVITGRSGSGKSTLFRAIAGIWPFGSGRIERPMGTYLFLPQRPYIPLGTLRHAVCYPAPDSAYDDAAIKQALADVGLAHLVDKLDLEENWTLRLSGGEQQRLAVARALLAKPDWLFLDEATANLDREAETALYRVLAQRLPRTAIISIAHQETVARFHERHLAVERAPGECGRVLQAEPVEREGAVP